MVGEQAPGLPRLYFHLLRCITSGVLPPCCGRRASPGTATFVFPPPPVYYLRVVVGEQAPGLPRLYFHLLRCITSGVLPPGCGRRASPETATSVFPPPPVYYLRVVVGEHAPGLPHLYFHLLRCITSGVLPLCCGRRASPGTATSIFPPPPVYYLCVVVGEQAPGLPHLYFHLLWCIISGVLPLCCGRRSSP